MKHKNFWCLLLEILSEHKVKLLNLLCCLYPSWLECIPSEPLVVYHVIVTRWLWWKIVKTYLKTLRTFGLISTETGSYWIILWSFTEFSGVHLLNYLIFTYWIIWWSLTKLLAVDDPGISKPRGRILGVWGLFWYPFTCILYFWKEGRE